LQRCTGKLPDSGIDFREQLRKPKEARMTLEIIWQREVRDSGDRWVQVRSFGPAEKRRDLRMTVRVAGADVSRRIVQNTSDDAIHVFIGAAQLFKLAK
jgi:hypothetical protein